MKDRNFGRRSASSARCSAGKLMKCILYACRMSVDCHTDQMKVDYDTFLFHRENRPPGILGAKTDVEGLRLNHNILQHMRW